MRKETINIACGIILIIVSLFLVILALGNMTFTFNIAMHDVYYVFSLLDIMSPFIFYFLITGLIHLIYKQRLRIKFSLGFLILSIFFFYFGFGKEIIENTYFFAEEIYSKEYHILNTFEPNNFSLFYLILFLIVPQIILFINVFSSKYPNLPK